MNVKKKVIGNERTNSELLKENKQNIKNKLGIINKQFNECGNIIQETIETDIVNYNNNTIKYYNDHTKYLSKVNQIIAGTETHINDFKIQVF